MIVWAHTSDVKNDFFALKTIKVVKFNKSIMNLIAIIKMRIRLIFILKFHYFASCNFPKASFMRSDKRFVRMRL